MLFHFSWDCWGFLDKPLSNPPKTSRINSKSKFSKIQDHLGLQMLTNPQIFLTQNVRPAPSGGENTHDRKWGRFISRFETVCVWDQYLPPEVISMSKRSHQVVINLPYLPFCSFCITEQIHWLKGLNVNHRKYCARFREAAGSRATARPTPPITHPNPLCSSDLAVITALISAERYDEKNHHHDELHHDALLTSHHQQPSLPKTVLHKSQKILNDFLLYCFI